MTALVHQYCQFLVATVLVVKVQLFDVQRVVQLLDLLNTTGIITSIIILWQEK